MNEKNFSLCFRFVYENGDFMDILLPFGNGGGLEQIIERFNAPEVEALKIRLQYNSTATDWLIFGKKGVD